MLLRSLRSLASSGRSLPPAASTSRRLMHGTPVRASLANYNLSALSPATADDLAFFRARTPGGFAGAHGVAEGMRPVGFDPLPEVNARGGRDAAGWRAMYEGIVAENWTNLHGTMHGGCGAWIVDNLTGRAVEALATDTWWGPAVSINLDLTYHAPATVGMNLAMLVTIDRMTGSIAYTRCEMFDRDSGERIVSGNHVMMWKKPKVKG